MPLKKVLTDGLHYFSLFPLYAAILRTLSPVSSIRCAVCIIRSIMASATVGSPIASYQLSLAVGEVMMMDLRPCRSLYYIEQDGSFLGIKVHKEEVIQYEQCAPFDSLLSSDSSAFYFCHLKRTHKFRSIRIICPYALLAGFIPHCCGKEALPGTRMTL